MKSVSKLTGIFALAAMVTLAGCGKNDTAEPQASTAAVPKAEPKNPPSPELQPLVLKEPAPANQVGVAMARESAEEGQEVVVEGRLKDFVDGKAAFTMVDGSIPSCLEDGMAGQCPTPWDYCCVPPKKLASNMATVELIGAGGEALAGHLHGVNSIDNLSTVVVTGKARKDDAGNLTIAADKVYLK